MIKLTTLEDQIIVLCIQVARNCDTKNRFFGTTTGRVRVINSNVWVGEFCFDDDAEVTYDQRTDEYKIRVEAA